MASDTPDIRHVTGIHHVTGIVGDAATSVEFYTTVLGLGLLRTTVNYEDILQHHLYFGTGGDPGSVLTVFPDPTGDPGRVGRPGYEAVAFAVPPGSLVGWADRLADHGVDAVTPDPEARFGDRHLRTTDPAGTTIELVERDDPREPWLDGPVPEAMAIRGIDGVSALPTDPYGAATVLETLGFEYVAETNGAAGDARIRYRIPGEFARTVDLLDRDGAFLREGPGTLHHLAVRVPDREALLEWHGLFREREYQTSRVKDRHFFHSLYVRGPGGLLIELASDEPGAGGVVDDAGGDRVGGIADPNVEGHATDLWLPERFAADRELIESQLPPVISREDGDGADGTPAPNGR